MEYEASQEQVLDNLLSNAVKYSPRGGAIDEWLSEEGKGSTSGFQGPSR